jgi:type IV secretory pathway TraG/TraD family ATPase VirD4
MVLYDFKYDDLSQIAYNYFLKYRHVYPGQPAFYNINFDDLSRSHRCNPLAPSTLSDITDANESARIILLGLNKEWVEKQGEFFQESAINFVTALIWFLRKYKDGIYCSWPHVIELSQIHYRKLFSILRTETEIGALINPFINALLHGAFEQLEGQIASASISLAKLSSPSLYYVLTGNDFTLDINDPQYPKIVCLGNSPQRTHVYGAVLSVYINTITRLTNRKGRHHMAFNFDEFSTIIANSIDRTIATARSNKIAVTLALQDAAQLRLAYGKEYAEVVTNVPANLISGQVVGDTAKFVSDRFGKILQQKESTTHTATDTNITRSMQFEEAVPASRIASLSSGEFVGMVVDNPDQPIPQKGFYCKILNDHAALEKEQKKYRELPKVRTVTERSIRANDLQIKSDIYDLVESEMSKMLANPDIQHLIID